MTNGKESNGTSNPRQPRGIARMATQLLHDAVQRSTVVAIVGPRQSGKSTLAVSLNQAEIGWTMLTFDDPVTLEFAKSDPKGFLTEYKSPLILDEIQRCPELLLPLKLFVDKDRSPGRYVLTGSANLMTLPKVSESLAGRMEVLDLHPFVQAELEGSTSNNFCDITTVGSPKPAQSNQESQLCERIVRGGFPEPALKSRPADRRAWHQSYTRTLLEKDVRDLSNIADGAGILRVLRVLAARSGSILNSSSLGREVGLPETTLRRYVDLLGKLFLVHTVGPYVTDVAVRFIKAPKVYLADTGMAASLLGIDRKGLASDELRLAPLAEGFVANELRRLIAYSESGPALYHFRSIRQYQVDFVLEYPDGSVVAIAIKAGKGAYDRDAAGIKYLAEIIGPRFHRGFVLYDGQESFPIAKGIWAMPISALWQPDLFINLE